jgi:hypothetical protein
LEYLEYTRICPAAHITGISAILSQCLKIAIILPDQGQAIQVVDQTVKPQLPAVPVVHHHFPHSNCMFFLGKSTMDQNPNIILLLVVFIHL